jgi:dinuclear metal center YbgI/SA1388 family protein
MRVEHIIEALETLAPTALAEPWDKVGLHVGDPAQQVKRGLLCIDLTEAVVAEAIQWRAELIIAYHPPIFKPLARLTPTSWKQRALLTAVKRGIAIYSPHTALDAARDGITDWLCAGIGPGATCPIAPRPASAAGFKLVTVIAAARANELVTRLLAAGAQAGTDALTSLHDPARVQLSLTCDARALPELAAELRAAHHDDEPARFDVIPLAAAPRAPATRVGAGRILTLDRPIGPRALAKRVKARLGLKTIELAAPTGLALLPRAATPGKITRVAVCPGAGGGLFEQVRRVDAYLTGEMRHHDVLAAVGRGQVVALAGHTQTERPYLPTYRARALAELRRRTRGRRAPIELRVSKADKAPSRVV